MATETWAAGTIWLATATLVLTMVVTWVSTWAVQAMLVETVAAIMAATVEMLVVVEPICRARDAVMRWTALARGAVALMAEVAEVTIPQEDAVVTVAIKPA